MTHELKKIYEAAEKARNKGLKCVLATVVDLEGSSYRKPGVRMLLIEDGTMIGAVSGGCVEKDIQRQSESVFKDDLSKMMTYDGRYRLGCEGILYILLERFDPSPGCVAAFWNSIKSRTAFNLSSLYRKAEENSRFFGTHMIVEGRSYSFWDEALKPESRQDYMEFRQTMPPCFKLMIFGTEHDAVVLCNYAALNGWEVTVVSGPLESKTIENFPGATSFYSISPDALELSLIDSETALVLMSHNFANDLKYLMEIKDTRPAYIGMLGPAHRREKIIDQLMEYCPEVTTDFLEMLHGPAGLNLGAETPQEIAISIMSEILTVVRGQNPIPLREKNSGIHAKP